MCARLPQDWWHIHRVRQTALSLAVEEALPAADLEIIELAALLHDIGDWKYADNHSETVGRASIRDFLASQSYPASRIDLVDDIVKRIGFKDELAGVGEMYPALAVVQDADRLDAIGAVGSLPLLAILVPLLGTCTAHHRG